MEPWKIRGGATTRKLRPASRREQWVDTRKASKYNCTFNTSSPSFPQGVALSGKNQAMTSAPAIHPVRTVARKAVHKPRPPITVMS